MFGLGILKSIALSLGHGGRSFRNEHVAIRAAVRVVEKCFSSLMERPQDCSLYAAQVVAYKDADRAARLLVEDATDIPYAYRLLVFRELNEFWCCAFEQGSKRVRPRVDLSERLQTLYQSRLACLYTVARYLLHWSVHAARGTFYPLHLPAI